MHLTRLHLHNFRNHADTSLACSPGVHLFLGDNGEGKTNALEGIAYLCLGRSFSSSSDATVARIGGDGFAVRGVVRSDHGVEYKLECTYEAASGAKRIAVGGAEVERRADLIGQFPVVVLAPEHGAITQGAPGDRRKFLDLTLSQAGRSYLDDLLEYRKALRQRNRLLLEARQSRSAPGPSLEPWNEVLVAHGSRLAVRRAQFAEEFRPYVDRAFVQLTESEEQPAVTYRSPLVAGPEMSVESATAAFRETLATTERDEIRAGTTLVGPHRDELELSINGLGIRTYASQGQHKTFLVGLKMAEFSYLQDRCRETPILLLDDVFSELDEHRCKHLLGLVSDVEQVFITATDERFLAAADGAADTIVRHRVRGGAVEPVVDAASH